MICPEGDKMTRRKRMTDYIKLIWHFIHDPRIEELASFWKNTRPNAPIADDETIMVKMICKLLERKYDISNEEIRHEIEDCVNELAAENKEKQHRKQDKDA